MFLNESLYLLMYYQVINNSSLIVKEQTINCYQTTTDYEQEQDI